VGKKKKSAAIAATRQSGALGYLTDKRTPTERNDVTEKKGDVLTNGEITSWGNSHEEISLHVGLQVCGCYLNLVNHQQS